MNVLLCALYDGRVDVNYLRTLADPALRSQFARWQPSVRFDATPYYHEKDDYGWRTYERATLAAFTWFNCSS